MAYSLTKIWSAMAVTLVTLSGVASADVDYRGPVNSGPVYTSGPIYSSNDFGSSNQCCDPCNNPCNPCGGCGEWFVDAEFLYFKACEHGLGYGTETEITQFGPTGGPGQNIVWENKIKHPHHRWDVGYRFGLGYRFPCECWDAAIYWTHFDTDAHGHFHGDPTGSRFFTPAWAGVATVPVTGLPQPADGAILLGGNAFEGTGGGTGYPVEHASSHWKLQLDFIDFEVGRDFCFNSCLTLKPFIGVRGAFIRQRYEVEYDAETIVAGVLITDGPFDAFKIKNHFEGAGPRAGLETAYDIGCGLSLYGGAAASLLYGDQDLKTEEDYRLSGDVTSNTYDVFQKDKDCGIRAITDAVIGVRWQQRCCEKVVTVSIGYEAHFIFDENQFEKFTNFNGQANAGTDINPEYLRSDLSIQGLVVAAKLDF